MKALPPSASRFLCARRSKPRADFPGGGRYMTLSLLGRISPCAPVSSSGPRVVIVASMSPSMVAGERSGGRPPSTGRRRFDWESAAAAAARGKERGEGKRSAGGF